MATDVARHQVKRGAVDRLKEMAPFARIANIVLDYPIPVEIVMHAKKIEDGKVRMINQAVAGEPRVRQRKELTLIEQVMARISRGNRGGSRRPPVEQEPDVSVELKQALELRFQLG